MSPRLLPFTAVLGLAACADPPPAAPANDAATASVQTSAPPVSTANAADPAAARTAAEYVGRWTGPEGLLLDVRTRPGGGMTIDNQYTLDDRGTFTGSVTPAGLHFVRGGRAVTAVPTDGDGTGMKWLAGERDCLVVISGSEGYCRR